MFFTPRVYIFGIIYILYIFMHLPNNKNILYKFTLGEIQFLFTPFLIILHKDSLVYTYAVWVERW